MRVLVVGATGLLGTELVRLLENRYETLGWSRRAPIPAPAFRSRIETVDITDPDAVFNKLGRWEPQVVIHSAAMSDVDACERDPVAALAVNAGGTANVAQACAANGAVLIAVSTDYVFDGSLERPYREEDATNPISVYGRSKLEGERRALELVPRCVLVRVSGIFGPARQNFVSSSAQKLRAGQPVPVVTEQRYSPSYSVDLAAGIEALTKQLERDPQAARQGGPLYGPLHLTNEGGASRLEVARCVAECIGVSDPQIQQVTWEALQRPARRPRNSVLDCDRFRRVSGAPLRTWKEAVRAFLEQ